GAGEGPASASHRVWWVVAGLLGGFGVIALQFLRLQVAQHDFWTERARRQHEFTVREEGRRGRFFANVELCPTHPATPVPLVHDVPKFHLAVDPQSIPEQHRSEMAKRLAQWAGSKAKILEELGRPSHYRRLAMWLDQEIRDKIDGWWHGYAAEHHLPRNALFFVEDYQRSHPYGRLAGQVLHTIRDFKDAETQQGLPTGGLELTLNSWLRGTPGTRLFQRSPLHVLDEGTIVDPAIPGADITLTINHMIQSFAEEALETGVLQAQAKAGWAIVMEPLSGEILALAQYPFFEPARYRDYFADPTLTDRARVRSILDLNEPGSTMKALTVAIALQANKVCAERGKPPIFLPEEKIAIQARSFPGRNKVLHDTKPLYYANLDIAVQKSSNVYMATLVQRIIEQLGAEWYRAQLDKLGFGRRTGVELLGEITGRLPRLEHHHHGRPEWSGSTPYSIAIGHGLGATSLQMARAFCTLANGGHLVRPTLIKRITREQPDGSQKILYDGYMERKNHPPERVLDRDICRRVVHAMRFMADPGGGARKKGPPGYSSAAKSGTSEKVIDGRYSKTIHFSSFVGIVPAKRPALVVLVGIDEPAGITIPGRGRNIFGSACAAPVFCEIATRALAYLGVPYDEPIGSSPISDTLRAEHTAWVTEQKSLAALLEKWNTAPQRSK
ncbi:MAG: peptidoglycan D,D-transpeptidase FtsI family protein, partial [Chlamydiia bacterium]